MPCHSGGLCLGVKRKLAVKNRHVKTGWLWDVMDGTTIRIVIVVGVAIPGITFRKAECICAQIRCLQSHLS